MRSSLIKADLEDAGKSGLAIAKELKVSSAIVYNVINRRTRSRRIAKKVAEAIGKPFSEVFPEYLETSA